MRAGKKAVKFLLGLGLAVLLAAGSVFTAPSVRASAAGPDDGNGAEPGEEGTSWEDVLEGVISSNPEDASAPVTEKPQVGAPYHRDFTYGTDITLTGIYESNLYYFFIENYWDYRYAFAEIQIDVSQLISDVPASVTFTVNGSPVVSYLIDYENGRSQTFYVVLPTRLLREGYNSFEITGYTRVFDGSGCLDGSAVANWVSVRGESYIQVGYDLKDHQQRISYFPYPFISSVDSTGRGSYMAVSDAMTEPELEAALTLRAALSAKTDREDRIHLVTASAVPGSANGVILISEYANLPQDYRRIIDGRNPGSLTDRAMVLFTENHGTPVLLITSQAQDCLMEAVSMLMDAERVSQERGSAAYVDRGGIALMQAALSENMTASGRYTLDALAETGVRFIGPSHQEAYIYLPFSGGYVLAESSKVVLYFRYSENLDFNRSMITVYWGDVPVASKKLARENAGGDELSFTMPYDVIGTHADSIRIAFELELPDLFCTPATDEMPWAYISEDSVFYLPVGEGTEYNFNLRPYPFERSSRFNDLVVVIPNEMGGVELQALGQLVAHYGESLEAYGNIRVVRAGDLTEELKRHHLIVFGTYRNNSVIRDLNESLGFSFNGDGSAYLGNSALILSDEYAREIVTLQIFESPYEAGRAVLVCSAVSEENFQRLSAFLEHDENVWALSGDTVLIDGELDLKTFNLQERLAKQDVPVLKRLLEENRESTVFAITALAVMLLLLLSVVLIFVRVYWNQRNKK